MVNLVGKVPPLEASGAAVTLVHPTATTVAGQWDVTYPQDMPEEDRPNLGPTRTFGYAHRLVNNPPRFARRHVRRDIQIDARDKNGWSNAESQLDSAARELSGDVVFQRTLSGEDLGVLVPNVDFKQGDVLPLLVWGMIVPATCTSIRYTLEDGRRTVEVGFGPDLQADTAGLAETMSQIDRQMRAEAAGIDEYLAKQLDEAKAASEQQVEGLKTYADSAAENAQKNATKAAEDLTYEVYESLDEVVMPKFSELNDSITSAQDEAKEALDKYREQVAAKIGEQGTLTTKLDSLNSKHQSLVDALEVEMDEIAKAIEDNQEKARQFELKVGENGTLVKDQRSTSDLIDAMVNGKPHAQLTNTQFQQQQTTVNKMQSAFNQKQVDINTGFQNLFDAQADINTVNSAFQAKQHDLNSGFKALFESQKFTNEMQLAFNQKQTGINDVYDAMWEEQQQRDLMQEYLIEYNKVHATATAPKRFWFTAEGATGGDIRVVRNSSLDGDMEVKQVYLNHRTRIRWSATGGVSAAIWGWTLSREIDGGSFVEYRRGTTLSDGPFEVTFEVGHMQPANYRLLVEVVLFLYTPLASGETKLDKVDDDFRQKGLKI